MGSNSSTFLGYASKGDLIGMQRFLENLHPNEAADIVYHEDGVGRTAVVLAAENEDFSMIRYLHMKKAPLRAKDHAGATPLMIACQTGNREISQFFLHCDIDCVYDFDEEFKFPLHIAAEEGHEHIVRLLIEHGADVLARDVQGRTVLDIAEERRHMHLVLLLSEHIGLFHSSNRTEDTTGA